MNRPSADNIRITFAKCLDAYLTACESEHHLSDDDRRRVVEWFEKEVARAFCDSLKKMLLAQGLSPHGDKEGSIAHVLGMNRSTISRWTKFMTTVPVLRTGGRRPGQMNSGERDFAATEPRLRSFLRPFPLLGKSIGEAGFPHGRVAAGKAVLKTVSFVRNEIFGVNPAERPAMKSYTLQASEFLFIYCLATTPLLASSLTRGTIDWDDASWELSERVRAYLPGTTRIGPREGRKLALLWLAPYIYVASVLGKLLATTTIEVEDETLVSTPDETDAHKP